MQTGAREMTVRAVFFDVGETLIDETRHWGQWADRLGIPWLTFFAALGGVIQSGRHHREVFRLFDPSFDYEAVEKARLLGGEAYQLLPSDFYPDAIPCLQALKKAGYRIGIAGNQPESCEAALRAAAVPADLVASSAGWGVEKPSSLFFERIVEAAQLPPNAIAYVGDRCDNDIAPAHRAGLIPILIKRGPWAFLQSDNAMVSLASARISTLASLPDLLPKL
jgi:FMN phosphatase YigB (HAD superfamily)